LSDKTIGQQLNFVLAVWLHKYTHTLTHTHKTHTHTHSMAAWCNMEIAKM